MLLLLYKGYIVPYICIILTVINKFHSSHAYFMRLVRVHFIVYCYFVTLLFARDSEIVLIETGY